MERKLPGKLQHMPKFPKIWAYVVVIFLSRVIFVFEYGKCMLMKLKQKKNNNYLR